MASCPPFPPPAPPVWVPDVSRSACTICRASFSLLVRRHHCRRCGDVFCSICASRRSLLPPRSAARRSSAGAGSSAPSDRDGGSLLRPRRVCLPCFSLSSSSQASLALLSVGDGGAAFEKGAQGLMDGKYWSALVLLLNGWRKEADTLEALRGKYYHFGVAFPFWHYVLWKDPSYPEALEMMLLTLFMHKGGVFDEKDALGRIPLHVAMSYCSSPGLVAAVLAATPPDCYALKDIWWSPHGYGLTPLQRLQKERAAGMPNTEAIAALYEDAVENPIAFRERHFPTSERLAAAKDASREEQRIRMAGDAAEARWAAASIRIRYGLGVTGERDAVRRAAEEKERKAIAEDNAERAKMEEEEKGRARQAMLAKIKNERKEYLMGIKQNMERAKEICYEDIIEYGLIWEDVKKEELDDLRVLEGLVNSLPCAGKQDGKLHQPMIDDLDPKSPAYIVKLGTKFEEHDETIFSHVSSLADELGYVFHEGKPKTSSRAIQKAILAYESDYSLLKDLRRGSIVCPKVRDIVRLVQRLAEDPAVLIRRKMNRFAVSYKANDESAGYRDLQFSVQIPGTELIWELQIHLTAIQARKTMTKEKKDARGMSGHARYVAYREIMELLKQKQKMADLSGAGEDAETLHE